MALVAKRLVVSWFPEQRVVFVGYGLLVVDAAAWLGDTVTFAFHTEWMSPAVSEAVFPPALAAIDRETSPAVVRRTVMRWPILSRSFRHRFRDSSNFLVSTFGWHSHVTSIALAITSSPDTGP
jgi:hypothetical protein